MRYQLPGDNIGTSMGSLSSMIDIVFLLIIFFVVTASFDREQLDSQVALPEVDSAAIKTLPSQRLIINVLTDGSVKVGFHQIPASEVPNKLGSVMRTLKAEKETVIIVNGDRETPHKYIAMVMNTAAQAGYGQVRINAIVTTEKR